MNAKATNKPTLQNLQVAEDTLIHVQGLPFTLPKGTIIEGLKSNAALANLKFCLPEPISLLERVTEVKREYLEDYEFRGEDEHGRDASHSPTDFEKTLIDDAINGLLADDEFEAAYETWLMARRRRTVPPCTQG